MNTKPSASDHEQPDGSTCPQCGGCNVSGLMASFWVPLGADGEPDGQWNDWSDYTELSERRMCRDCNEEW